MEVEGDMKDHPHCYHIDFAHETETCCWCSGRRKLDFGQGYFGRDPSMTTPLLSVWWWRYNTKMYGLYRHLREQPATPGASHGPYGSGNSLTIEYDGEGPCPGAAPDQST